MTNHELTLTIFQGYIPVPISRVESARGICSHSYWLFYVEWALILYNFIFYRRCGRPCRRKERIRDGTIFEEWSRVPLPKLFLLIFFWSNKIQVVFARQFTNLSKNVIIRMYQLLRAVCSRDLQRNPIQIGGGGQNFVVQVDESMIRHRQRVSHFHWSWGLKCSVKTYFPFYMLCLTLTIWYYFSPSSI